MPTANYELQPDFDKLLQADIALKNWYNCITDEGTKRTYRFGMLAFLEYVKTTPTELIQQADEDYKQSPLMRQNVVLNHFKCFLDYMKKEFIPRNARKAYAIGKWSLAPDGGTRLR
ncbi:MAG: hypothetical protein ABSG92_08230 [Conexivisphaerales archaeon]|jgi:hypothetical protein